MSGRRPERRNDPASAVTRTITATSEAFAHVSEHDKGGIPAMGAQERR
jgi:hypothetical protein